MVDGRRGGKGNLGTTVFRSKSRELVSQASNVVMLFRFKRFSKKSKGETAAESSGKLGRILEAAMGWR